jgi:hypothetical protein
MKYSVEISLVMDGQYVPDSDIHIWTYNSYDKAQSVAEAIDVQDADLYECYVYTLNDDDEILETSRIW